MGNLPQSVEEYRQWYPENIPEGVEWGKCWCSPECGIKTRISSETSRSKLWFIGQPLRYALGHRHRKSLPAFFEEDRGYTTPCKIWQRYTYKGYGIINRKGCKNAHRVLWEEKHGALPEGHVLHHLCEVPLCVNLEHLEVIPIAEHVRRHPQAGMSYERAANLRQLYATGQYTQVVLAAQFGIGVTMVKNILTNKSWPEA